jgi:aminopeptidase
MTDPRLDAWARTLVNYSTRVRPGDTVSIEGDVAARSLLRAIHRETLRAGGLPIVVARLGELQADLLELGSDEQIEWIAPHDRWARADADVFIRVLAEENTKALSNVPPERQIARRRATGELLQLMMERAAREEMRWTLTLFPTDAYAQDAEMDTDDYAAFVFDACKLNTPDPAAAWRDLAAMQQRLIDWLAGKREVRLRGPDTDLYLGIEGRTWINCDGTNNFPDGEIFTGPIEDATHGHVRFSFPVVTQGREIHDVRLRFESGRVVEASASRNEAFLIESLDADPGARVLGELAFGTNFGITRFTKNILFDEKIGGTVHVAVGGGYPESGSVNQSAIHWDLICDLRRGGTIDVDGKPFLRDGQYLV